MGVSGGRLYVADSRRLAAGGQIGYEMTLCIVRSRASCQLRAASATHDPRNLGQNLLPTQTLPSAR